MSGPGGEGEVLWEGDTDEGYLRVREGVQRRMCEGVWRRAYEPEAHECAFVLARQHRELVAALKEAKGLLQRAIDARALDGMDELEAEAMVCLGHWQPDGRGGYEQAEAAAGRLTEEG